MTSIYKIYETPTSQLYRYLNVQGAPVQQTPDHVIINVECPYCKTKLRLQANSKDGIALENGAISFPKDNVLICPACKKRLDLTKIKGERESTKNKVT
jgi:uncharacterized protein YbaR (Trm112 family)